MHAARTIAFALSASALLVACDDAASDDAASDDAASDDAASDEAAAAAADSMVLQDAAMDGRIVRDALRPLRDLPDGLRPVIEADAPRSSCAHRIELDDVRPRHDELRMSGEIEIRTAACDAAGPGDAARERVVLPAPDPRVRIELALDIAHGVADMQLDATLDCAPGAMGELVCVASDDSVAIVRDRHGAMDFELARMALPFEDMVVEEMAVEDMAMEDIGQLHDWAALVDCVARETPYGDIMVCPL